MARIQTIIDDLSQSGGLNQLPTEMADLLRNSIERLFQPEFQSQLPLDVQQALQRSVGESVGLVFWIAFIFSWLCLAACFYLPGTFRFRKKA
jgi:hypothetical protein